MPDINEAKNYLDKRLEELASLSGDGSVLKTITDEIESLRKQVESLSSSVKVVKTKVDKLEKDKGSK